jgi:DNA-binding beta-propeller fold protein YncE
MRRLTAIPVAAAAVALLGTALAPPASAAPAEDVTGGLVSPLSVAVGGDGTTYVAQNFAGLLTAVPLEREATVIHAAAPRHELGAVSVAGETVTFATTSMKRKDPGADLYRLEGEDAVHVADLWKYERRQNPDADTRYGMTGISRSCQQKLPGFLKRYTGIQESHPYATTVVDGTTYVADAAANAVFRVSEAGKVRTASVLPAVKVTVTRKIRKAYELPKCVVGGTYKLEAVPTDVELGPDGNLYVTSLPGGPEDGSLGLNGGVFKVDPASGATTRISGGLLSPTGLAISPTGDAYIAQLFAGNIIKKPLGGDAEVFAETPFPGDVEFADGYLYATNSDITNQGGEPDGKVVRWDLSPVIQ